MTHTTNTAALRDTIRASGGIVHSDGNIFFASDEQFLAAASAALAAPTQAAESEILVTLDSAMDAISYMAWHTGDTYEREAVRMLVTPAAPAQAGEQEAFLAWWPTVGQAIGQLAAWEAWQARAARGAAQAAPADIGTAPQFLNLNDRAMWVLGWNACLDAAQAAQGGK